MKTRKGPSAWHWRRLRLGLGSVLAAVAVGGAAAGEQPEPATISGFVRAADFRSVAGATVRVIGGAEAATVDADGRFTVRPGAIGGAGGGLEIELEGYYRSSVRLEPGEGTAPAVVLVPRAWTITAGRYAGQVVPIDLEGATGAACGDCGAFYGSVLGDERSTLPPGIPAWPPTAFPLEVAFDRENGALVSARDSVAFWQIVRTMEEHFGLRLFRPAALPRVLANVSNDGPGSLLVLIDPRLMSTGWGSSVSQSGDILAGAVHFRHARTFSSSDGAAIVAHEIFHALGFGHTCRWRSIVADVKRCRGNQAPAPTASDVAHAQLLWRIRELERGARISTTVAAALRD